MKYAIVGIAILAAFLLNWGVRRLPGIPSSCRRPKKGQGS